MKTYLKLLIIGAVIFSASSYSSAYAEVAVFNRYLQKGDSGADVLLLQKVLNTDTSTQVAATGTGAPGNEIEFYGELTKQAVIKLQKKHDLGTSYGFFTIYSGALDEKTRTFLNNQKIEIDAQSALNSIYRISATNPNAPFIESISPRSIDNGDEITIIGRNFGIGALNTVRLTYNSIQATSTDGTTLKVRARSQLQNLFDEQAEDMNNRNRERTLSNIPNIPLFITIQNERGLSNTYQVYTKLQ